MVVKATLGPCVEVIRSDLSLQWSHKLDDEENLKKMEAVEGGLGRLGLNLFTVSRTGVSC